MIKSKEEGPKLASTLDIGKAARLEQIRREIKKLQSEEKALKREVDGYFRNLVEPESTDIPSETFERDGVTYQVKWGRQDRSRLNPERIKEFLQERGMWLELSKEERVLDEEAFKSALQEGIISLEDVQTNCMDVNIVRTVEVKAIK